MCDINKEVCGTPGYLAPELLKAAMYEDAYGYDQAVDLLVVWFFFFVKKNLHAAWLLCIHFSKLGSHFLSLI